METYRISIKTHVANLKTIWLYFAFLIVSIYMHFFSDRSSDHDYFALILISGFLFLVFLVPMLVLHVNYYLVNKYDELTYDNVERSLVFRHKEREVKFYFYDIEKFESFKSYAMINSSMSPTTTSNYHYGVITLKSGIKITITSLLTGLEMDLPLPEEKVIVHEAYWRLVKEESLVGIN